MALYTDRPAVAATLLHPAAAETFVACPRPPGAGSHLLAAIFSGAPELFQSGYRFPGWRQLLVRGTAPASQYDQLIQLLRAGTAIPDRTACIAAEGSGFHGFRGRAWSALRGNVHLAVHFAPRREIERFDTAFMALAAISLAEAVDSVPNMQGRARIKWVNDILVGGRKVGGVLAYTQSRGRAVEAVVLGLGLNVEATPDVERSAFVPAVGSLRDFAAVSTSRVLIALLCRLDSNYMQLLGEGFQPIMDRYRSLSAVLGQEVTIYPELGSGPAKAFAAGRVHGIGDSLELHLDGRTEPVRSGRLLLGNIAPEMIA